MRSSTGLADEAVVDVGDGDAVTAGLCADLARYTAYASAPADGVDGAARVDRIAVLEQIRSAVAAAQNAEIVAFGGEQVEQQISHIETGRLDPRAVGRGIADQIAPACHVSPFWGSRRLDNARVLAADLPVTAALPGGGSDQ